MPRVLIFLFDGTANDPSMLESPTNIFRLTQLVSESREFEGGVSSQVTFYSPGIGTQFYATGFLEKWVQRALENESLYNMALRAYVNLSVNYRQGDQIILLGFSRGAIACRMFARIISDFGLLRSSSIHHLSDLFECFGDAIKGSFKEYFDKSSAFKAENGNRLLVDVKIDFMGLFDCVGGPKDDSGIRNFLEKIDTSLSDSISSYYHLMALHDIRSHFILWRLAAGSRGKEVWHPGVHSDVGGGYDVRDLADVALLSMADRLASEAGVALDKKAYKILKDRVNNRKADENYVFKVNYEHDLNSRRKYRSDYFQEGDKVHEMHEWLIANGKDVYWKSDGITRYLPRIQLELDQG